MKYKTLTPDILLEVLTRKKPSFKIILEAEVTVSQTGGLFVVVEIDEVEYMVDTLREFKIILTVVNDMFDQVERGVKNGGVVKQIIARNTETGEEILIAEEKLTEAEDEEDDDPKILS